MPPVFNLPLYATEMEEELVGEYPHHLLQVRYQTAVFVPTKKWVVFSRRTINTIIRRYYTSRMDPSGKESIYQLSSTHF